MVFHSKDIGKTRKEVSEIKWWTLPASPSSTHPGEKVNKLAIEPQRELHPPVRNTLTMPVKKNIYLTDPV